MIDSYLEKHLSDVESVHSLSQMLYRNLIEQGYTGSERTLRNHLNKHEKVIQYVQGKQLREGEHIYVKGYKYR